MPQRVEKMMVFANCARMPLLPRLPAVLFFVFSVFFRLAPCAFAAETAPARSAAVQRAYEQFRAYYLGSDDAFSMRDSNQPPPDPRLALKYAQSLAPDGHWPDLDYASTARSGWAPERHCSRMIAMAASAGSAVTSAENRTTLLAAIHRAFAYWISHDFQCPNWWFNEIGIPKSIGTIALLLGDDLKPEEFLYATATSLARYPIARTGQNKVWLAGNTLMRGLLAGDEAALQSATEAIWSQVSISSDSEGIQADFSFHQHGAQLQFGNYGMAFAVETARWCQIMRNTPWQLSPEKLEIFRRYLLDGQGWISWRGAMDISSCGRQLMPHSPVSKTTNIAGVMKQARTFDPTRRNDYEAYLQRNQPNAVNDLVGERFFWRSDYVVHRRPDLAVTLKMSSNRVIGTELVNSENLSGYHLGDGATYFYRTGKEYEDIFPVWDWSKLPGVTCAQTPPPAFTTSAVPRDFVGGVSDGATGAYALDYARDGVEAHKAWFLSDDLVVCLGTAIRGTVDARVATTIDQSLLRGPVRILRGTTWEDAEGGERDLTEEVGAVEHDGWRITLLEPTALRVASGPVTGNWHRVFNNPEAPTADVTKDVFTLWIDHGSTPHGGKYAYVVSPKEGPDVASFVKVLENTADRQAVHFANGKVALIFWKKGETFLPDGRKIAVDAPCAALVSGETIRISDPTQKLESLSLTVEGVAHTVRFPSGPLAGTANEVKID